MTDEEMAEEYNKRNKCFREDVGKIQIEYKMYLNNLKQAFLDGLKAGRPQWHDLRKDPNDLPLTEREVMVFIEWKNTENETEYAYDLGTRHFNGDWCLDVFSSEDKDIKVIGWYDFPQFKE